MGRYRRRMYEEYSKEFSTDESFNVAYQKVKRIKGFYTHLRVYIIVNILIIIANVNGFSFSKGIIHSGLFDWQTYSTALFWGIGVLAHAFSVFGRDVFFSADWEQRKIDEYMKKESSKNKWE